MYGGDLLIIEQEKGPYIATKVGMLWMTLLLNVHEKKHVIENAKRLYESFGDGEDPGEFDLYSLTNLKRDPRCGADCRIIIPKTKDRFLHVDKFLAGDYTCQISKKIDDDAIKEITND